MVVVGGIEFLRNRVMNLFTKYFQFIVLAKNKMVARWTYKGISMIVVIPPAAAALVAV